MSIEKSFDLIGEELQNLKKIFERDTESLKQRIEFYRAEIQAQYAEHRAELDKQQKLREQERAEFNRGTLELEARFFGVADTRPKEKEFLECLPSMAFICDEEGRILDCNQAFTNFLGAGALFPFGNEAIVAAHEIGSWSGEITLKNIFGAEDMFDARLLSWDKHSGGLGGFVGVAIEKTRIAAAEKEIRTLKDEIKSLDFLLNEGTEKNIHRRELRCSVLGEHASGKTILLNKLIGEEIFPQKTQKKNFPVLCGGGTRRTLAVHYWNGDMELYLDESAQKMDEFSESGESIWFEWRLPNALTPRSMIFEEAEDANLCDMFIAILPLRKNFPVQYLESLEKNLKDGVYGVFAISKIDIETDDYEGTNIALSAREKIDSACESLRRDLKKFPKFRDCPIVPISLLGDINIDVLRWYIADAASSVQADIEKCALPAIKYPTTVPKLKIVQDALLPMVEVFRDQQLQTKFAECVSIFEKRACVLLSPRRSDAHKLVSRLAHDISFAKTLGGTEKKWVLLAEQPFNLPFKRWIDSVQITPPDSILRKVNFALAPEDAELGEYDWDALFSAALPVVMLSGELEFAPYKNALKKHGFCAACGDGLIFDAKKIEHEKRKLLEFAGFDVPLFVYENYYVRD